MLPAFAVVDDQFAGVGDADAAGVAGAAGRQLAGVCGIEGVTPLPSTRPSTSDARRCGHNSSNNPTRPSPARNATKFSPSNRTAIGPSPCTNCDDNANGNQQCPRINRPIAASPSTRVSRSLSSRVTTKARIRLQSSCCKTTIANSRDDVPLVRERMH